MKTAFLASMSHEIRTPINVILGMNEMILRESTSEQLTAYASNIQNAGKTLLSLINNILDTAKIESGKVELTEVDYQTVDLIFDLVVLGKEAAAKRGLVFQTEVDPELPRVLAGDPFHLERIAANFLSNAVKYTEEGFVTLGFGWEKEGESLSIWVQDSGLGIAPQDLDRLFESFTRAAHPAHRRIEGSGLGLAIAKELADLMGGTIKVESQVGVGSTFTVVLPQRVVDPSPVGAWEQKESAASRERTSFAAPRARILIVDDSPENLEVMQVLLKHTLVHIDTARSGAQCLAAAERTAYDLILLDYMMPGLDGLQTLKLLREKGIQTPVVAVTAHVLFGTREGLLQEGFTAFLAKPIVWPELEQVLIELLPPELVRLETEREVVDQQAAAELQQKGIPFGVGVVQGLKYVNGDLGQYRTLARIFYQHSPENQGEVAVLFQAEDWEGLTFLVHSLKSKALAIGAVELSEQAAALEKHLRRGDTRYVQTAMPLLFLLWERVLEGLKEMGVCQEF